MFGLARLIHKVRIVDETLLGVGGAVDTLPLCSASDVAVAWSLTSLAQFTEKELAIVKTHMWCSRDHDRDRKFDRRYVCLAKPEWLRYDLQGDELSDAVYLSLQM